MKRLILVVEDDAAIRTGLVDLLDSEGYETRSAADGHEALRLFQQGKPDLVLLDVMIPGQSGYDVCRAIRAGDRETPILMLTAKTQEVDKVVGLELGADDYIVKPFGMNELLARIRAALRRSDHRIPTGEGGTASSGAAMGDPPTFGFGDVTVDPRTLEVTRGGVTVPITRRELTLLREFMTHDGEVLDRETLLQRVWGQRYQGTTRTLDQHIAKLRQKVEADAANPRHIRTVHGAGYRFVSRPD